MGFCFRKYPDDANKSQFQVKVKNWEPQQKEVYEEDTCYYKDQGGGNVQNRHHGKKGATEYKEKKTKRSGRHSCFYQAER